MDVEMWALGCLFAGECSKVMMKTEHIPQFVAQVEALEKRWRDIPPACPKCGGEASLDLLTGDGDPSTDWFACDACGAESGELGMVFGYQEYDPWNKQEEEYANRFN